MKSSIWFAVLTVAALYLYFSCCSADSSLIVNVKQGSVQGIKAKSLNGNKFYTFMSIPYAEPPVGKLRFKDPVPLQSWPETVDGSKMPEYCLQYSLYDFMKPDKSNITTVGREDCLYLNVFTPKPNDDTANLPVMVYIHGGGFFSGGAVEAPPNALMDKEIVLVVLQYRLGVLGFLSTEDSELPGNMGLKDQQLALKWVKENILQFGGDPNRVTLFGESAGGAATHMQMLSPGSKGLFQRIITQSGTALCPWATKENHRVFAANIGRIFNCPLEESTKDYIECLQTIDAKYLVQSMYKEVAWGLAPVHTLPRIDGDFFPDNIEVLLKNKNYNKVDVLSGITRDEGVLLYFLMLQMPNMVEELNLDYEVIRPLSLIMFEENAEAISTQVYQHYLGRKIINNIDAEKDRDNLIKLYTDRYFGVCHDITSCFLADDKDVSLYRYQLDYISQKSFGTLLGISMEKNKWVGHGDDLLHIFSGPPILIEPEVPDENDVKMRDIIISAWTNFAATGNPVSPNSPEYVWDKATNRNFNHLSLNLNPTMEKFSKAENRKFWLNLQSEQNIKYFSEEEILQVPQENESKQEL